MTNYQTLLTNCRLVGYSQAQQIGLDVLGNIVEITTEIQHKYHQEIDLKGDWLSLGGIDLQVNGGLGLAFPDLLPHDEKTLEAIGKYLWHQGVEGFCPTIVTTSLEKIQRSLDVITKFITHPPKTDAAKILGVHLEGPFLRYEKRGAHPAEYLLSLTLENLEQVLGQYHDIVKIITLAPELDPSGKVITKLKNLGITISLGHSLATEIEAKKAFDLGANMVTHAFNAMPSLHHREPGLLGEAIVNKSVYCGLIADGQHVVPIMMKLLLEASNFRVFLVSDALAPMGLEDGVYPWDTRQIEVKNGTARLPDGTLAGTTLPLLAGVKNLVDWGICDISQAITLATESPRKALGLPSLNVGQKANFLRWSWQDSQLTWKWLNI